MLIPGFEEFELDLELAFKRDLPPFIERVEAAPLSYINVGTIPTKKNGVYLLLQDNRVMYVGKTDSRGGFQDRLNRHATHLHHRKGIEPSSVFFKAIAIPVFKNADLEVMLIEHYKTLWNNSGFGGNDPGRQRDTQEPARFDKEYPIDIDIPVDFVPMGSYSCIELLKILSINLPYTFRYEKKLYQDELTNIVDVVIENMTVRDLLTLILTKLPEDSWQATVLLGRVIVYRERRKYPYQQSIILS
ncbi:Eco29kI family restriction endonuclease [Paenibacillus sp. FSL R7-0198]|uniref:Eco29kI family restriction endonuclease n=1 Tax=Paenibacillus sp. FSL R7-0198 TaxID=2921674 RepID=UPI0030F67CB4